MRRVASADSMVLQHPTRQKGKASKAADGQGCSPTRRRCRPAPQPGVCQARSASAREQKRARPGPSRAACSASNTRLDGCGHRLPSSLTSVRGAAVAGRAEAAASAADATYMLLKLATQRANYPIAAACTTAHHQGTEPQKEACLIHRRHARRAPAPDVLIERRCRVESLIKRSDRADVPAADVLVEGGCSIE